MHDNSLNKYLGIVQNISKSKSFKLLRNVQTPWFKHVQTFSNLNLDRKMSKRMLSALYMIALVRPIYEYTE